MPRVHFNPCHLLAPAEKSALVPWYVPKLVIEAHSFSYPANILIFIGACAIVVSFGFTITGYHLVSDRAPYAFFQVVQKRKDNLRSQSKSVVHIPGYVRRYNSLLISCRHADFGWDCGGCIVVVRAVLRHNDAWSVEPPDGHV